MSRGLAEALRGAIQGDVAFDEASRSRFSRDASLFEIMPAAVVNS
ncbi:MAG: hypothetical protein AAB601_01525 [Patescibacteria group bacterium]